jgi:hypothetical protein
LPGWLRSAGPLSGPFPTNFDVHRLDPDDRLTSTPAGRNAQIAAIGVCEVRSAMALQYIAV